MKEDRADDLDDWLQKKHIGRLSKDPHQEGGMGSGRKKTQPRGPKLSDLPPVKTPRAKPAMPDTPKKTAYAEPPYIRDGVKPLTMAEADKLIQEMQAKPMTGSTKKMSGGSKGKAPKHWTPVDFNVVSKQDEVPVPVGRAVKEMCEVCGIENNMHEQQDHPMIPPMPQMNGQPPMPQPSPQPPQEGLYGDLGKDAEPAIDRMTPAPPKQEGLYGDLGSAAEPAFDQMFPPPPQEQQPFPPQPNGMGMDMPPMPPAQIPPPMPPQEQMPPLPSPMPPAPNMQMQYTVSVPNSLSNQSIGGKKVNEMIREIEHAIRQ